MRRRLMNNLGLKIVALLFAAILWLMVVNINDPVEKKTYRDITVRILHSEIITNRGKTYRVQNDSNKVSVVVTAKRSVLEKNRSVKYCGNGRCKRYGAFYTASGEDFYYRV